MKILKGKKGQKSFENSCKNFAFGSQNFLTFHKGKSWNSQCIKFPPPKKTFIQKSLFVDQALGRSIEDFTLSAGWAYFWGFVSRKFSKLGTRRKSIQELVGHHSITNELLLHSEARPDSWPTQPNFSAQIRKFSKKKAKFSCVKVAFRAKKTENPLGTHLPGVFREFQNIQSVANLNNF